MRVKCPHCENPIDLLPQSTLEDIACPSCGSHFSLLDADDETETVLPQVEALRNFELVQRVGIGHFGSVWKARDTTLNRFVAIKLPHRQTVSLQEAALFFHEAQSAAALDHPNIVTVHEIGRSNNLVFIVSQFVDGLPLNEWVKQHRPDFRRVMQLCSEIGEALHHAHEKGVVHRDLKPQNVLIDANGKPHVTDFGLAKRENITYTIAVTGQPLGTPAYMPPEQARGEGRHADRRSDIYSLGVMMYEMLTGQRPFTGGKHLVLHQIIHDEPRAPRSIQRNLPRDLETICLKAMAKNPKQRYQTAQEMVDDLQRVLRGEPPQARPITALERGYRWMRRRPALTAAVVLAVLLLALIPYRYFVGPTGATHPIALETIPSGAHVVFTPLDARTGEPLAAESIHAGRSPISTRLPPGDYLVIASIDNDLFHEVYRHVPRKKERDPSDFRHKKWTLRNGVAILPSIRLHRQAEVIRNMALVKGGEFVGYGALTGVDPEKITVPAWYVATGETTVGDLRRAHIEVPMSLATLPSTARLTGISVDFAMETAELLGGRLPEYSEYQLLARRGNYQEILEAIHAANTTPEELARAALPQDRVKLALDHAVLGLFSSLDEWTNTWYAGTGTGQDYRVTWMGFGRPLPKTATDPATQAVTFQMKYDRGDLGMRCARSVRPRLRARDFIRVESLKTANSSTGD